MKIYRVGGSVRDEMLGRSGADRDFVVVGATPEEMLARGFRPVGRNFPVFLHPQTGDEYALARTERKRGRGHRGFSFHAAPEVTLEEDLARRDLTINAMARDADGTLIDPYGGAADLRRGLLRHVGPAFVEDPLRVLRVARFAARLGFEVAPETSALLKSITESGELATLAPERVWQELAGALMEEQPSRFFELLHRCGALAQLMPEVEGQFTAFRRGRVMPALDASAAAGDPLQVRYAVLAADPAAQRSAGARDGGSVAGRLRRVEALSARLKAPVSCRDIAALTARHRARIDRAGLLAAAGLLDLLLALDSLRRPERLAQCLAACAAYWSARTGRGAAGYPPARVLEGALAALRSVKGAALAVVVRGGRTELPQRLRALRLSALREWRAGANVRSSARARTRGRRA